MCTDTITNSGELHREVGQGRDGAADEEVVHAEDGVLLREAPGVVGDALVLVAVPQLHAPNSAAEAQQDPEDDSRKQGDVGRVMQIVERRPAEHQGQNLRLDDSACPCIVSGRK